MFFSVTLQQREKVLMTGGGCGSEAGGSALYTQLILLASFDSNGAPLSPPVERCLGLCEIVCVALLTLVQMPGDPFSFGCDESLQYSVGSARGSGDDHLAVSDADVAVLETGFEDHSVIEAVGAVIVMAGGFIGHLFLQICV